MPACTAIFLWKPRLAGSVTVSLAPSWAGREGKWQLMSSSASCSSWPQLSLLAEQVLLMWFQTEGHKLLVKRFAHVMLHFRLSFSKVNIGMFMVF